MLTKNSATLARNTPPQHPTLMRHEKPNKHKAATLMRNTRNKDRNSVGGLIPPLMHPQCTPQKPCPS